VTRFHVLLANSRAGRSANVGSQRAVDFDYGQSQVGPAMKGIPPVIQKHAEELRKIRLSQRWTSYSEALEQCRMVELHAATDSDTRSSGLPSILPRKANT